MKIDYDEEICPMCNHSLYNHGEWFGDRWRFYRFDHSEAASTQGQSMDCREEYCRCKLFPGDSILVAFGVV